VKVLLPGLGALVDLQGPLQEVDLVSGRSTSDFPPATQKKQGVGDIVEDFHEVK